MVSYFYTNITFGRSYYSLLYFYSPVQYIQAGIFLLVTQPMRENTHQMPKSKSQPFCVFCNEIKLMINISKPISIYQCTFKCPRMFHLGGEGGSARVFKNQQVFIYIIQHCRTDNIQYRPKDPNIQQFYLAPGKITQKVLI